MEDDGTLLTVCFRCGSSQALLQKECTQGHDSCSTCFHPFIRCMINYDVLPLIEFRPNDYLDETQTMDIIQSAMGIKKADALFHDTINTALTDIDEGYSPVQVDREILESFDRVDVYVMRCNQSNTVRYFRNMIPDIGVAICHHCCQFFHEEDFEYHYLKQGGCPICKVQSTSNVSYFISSKVLHCRSFNNLISYVYLFSYHFICSMDTFDDGVNIKRMENKILHVRLLNFINSKIGSLPYFLHLLLSHWVMACSYQRWRRRPDQMRKTWTKRKNRSSSTQFTGPNRSS